MKKTLVVLMASMIMSVGVAQAATSSSTSVSDWINKTSDSITKAEQDAVKKIEANKEEALAKKIEREKVATQQHAEKEKELKAKQAELKQKQAQKEKELKAKQEESQKKQAERKKKIETKKQQLKDLFTVE